MKNLLYFAIVLILVSCGGKSSVKINGFDIKTIPGADAGSIHTNFTDKGFTLDKNIGSEMSTWKCTKTSPEYEMSVMITGQGTDEITSVSATVLNYGESSISRIAEDFLGFVATMKYDGSDPETAKSWVVMHVGIGGSTTIGPVKLELTPGTERSIILRITAI